MVLAVLVVLVVLVLLTGSGKCTCSGSSKYKYRHRSVLALTKTLGLRRSCWHRLATVMDEGTDSGSVMPLFCLPHFPVCRRVDPEDDSGGKTRNLMTA